MHKQSLELTPDDTFRGFQSRKSLKQNTPDVCLRIWDYVRVHESKNIVMASSYTNPESRISLAKQAQGKGVGSTVSKYVPKVSEDPRSIGY